MEFDKPMKFQVLRVLICIVLGYAVLGCGSSTIPNTTVEDTSDNRAVVQFVEKYRHAVQRKDVAALLSLASPRYLDDNGSPAGTDDIDYENLKARLTLWKDNVLDVRYEIRYRNITYRETTVWVDYTYTGNYRIKSPDGTTRWSRRLADNRLILDNRGDSFLILSGM